MSDETGKKKGLFGRMFGAKSEPEVKVEDEAVERFWLLDVRQVRGAGNDHGGA